MKSIRHWLLGWLCGGLMVVFLIASWTVYRTARTVADTAQLALSA